MRLSRIIAATAVGLAMASLPAATATAQPYPPGLPSLTLSDTAVFVGETVTLTGDNFGPGETVEIGVTVDPLAAGVTGARSGGRTAVAMGLPSGAGALRQQPGGESLEVVADAEGDFQTRYRVSFPGRITFTAVGQESGLTASAALTAFPKKHHLPVTGDDVDTPIAVGGGLLATGVLLMLVTLAWRRRSRRRGADGEFEPVN